jgi:hypothetical protein
MRGCEGAGRSHVALLVAAAVLHRHTHAGLGFISVVRGMSGLLLAASKVLTAAQLCAANT